MYVRLHANCICFLEDYCVWRMGYRVDIKKWSWKALVESLQTFKCLWCTTHISHVYSRNVSTRALWTTIFVPFETKLDLLELQRLWLSFHTNKYFIVKSAVSVHSASNVNIYHLQSVCIHKYWWFEVRWTWTIVLSRLRVRSKALKECGNLSISWHFLFCLDD